MGHCRGEAISDEIYQAAKLLNEVVDLATKLKQFIIQLLYCRGCPTYEYVHQEVNPVIVKDI